MHKLILFSIFAIATETHAWVPNEDQFEVASRNRFKKLTRETDVQYKVGDKVPYLVDDQNFFVNCSIVSISDLNPNVPEEGESQPTYHSNKVEYAVQCPHNAELLETDLSMVKMYTNELSGQTEKIKTDEQVKSHYAKLEKDAPESARQYKAMFKSAEENRKKQIREFGKLMRGEE